MILLASAVLICVPFLYFCFVEFKEYAFRERILLSLFQSVTPRTAGFNTADYGTMREEGLLLTIVLMLIGGAPGSTAGGIKLTTFVVLILSARAYMHGKQDTSCGNRRIEQSAVNSAFTLFLLYLINLLCGTFLISMFEHIPVLQAMFECASALGTVGLTTGITPALGTASKMILIFFMYFGRVGALTLTYAITSVKQTTKGRLPAEPVTVG